MNKSYDSNSSLTTPSVSKETTETFTHELFGDTRIIRRGDELYFVAKDVVEKVGNQWSGKAVSHVPKMWKGVGSIITPGGTQNLVTLSEQGLYFYLGRCDKPAALQYQMWIAGEVVPSIRKTGGYSASEKEESPELVVSRGLIAAQGMIDRLKAKVADDAPKVEIHDAYLSQSVEEEKTVNWLAKKITGEGYRFSDKQLFVWLRDRGYLMRKGGAYRNVPYQRYIDLGWFRVKEVYVHSISDFRRTPLVTNLGMIELSKRIKQWCDKNLKVPA